MSGTADEALLEAARLADGEDVLVLGGGALALGAQAQIGDGWVYVVRAEVDELEELLAAAHAASASGVAYLVGQPPVLPLPDASVAVAVGRLGGEDEELAAAAVELGRVLAAAGRVALAEDGGRADAVRAALAGAGFEALELAEAAGEVVLSARLG